MSESLLSYIQDEIIENPMELFRKWFDEAKMNNASQFDSLCLSTLDREGGVNARYLKLRHLDNAGFTVVTDARGDKAQEIAHCPRASIVFLFSYKKQNDDIQRQVRIRGNLVTLNTEDVRPIYEAEPLIYKVRSHLLPQGSTISDWNKHRELCERVFKMGKESSLSMPEHFIGYKMIPEIIDFYHGANGLIADRLIYQKNKLKDEWTKKRIMV